jgi:hypothetical protein
MKKPKSAPTFKTEAEERKFWETHDSTDSTGARPSACAFQT